MNSAFLKLAFAELGESYDGRALNDVELENLLAKVAAKHLMSAEERVLLTRIAALFVSEEAPAFLVKDLGLAPGSTVADAVAAIRELKSRPARLAELARIRADALVDAAEAENKILPAEREFLRKKALANFEVAEAFVKHRRRWSSAAIYLSRSSVAKNWSNS